MKKQLLTALMLAAVINAQADAITFATEATYPPYESVESSGQIVGFDVDIMNALCMQMKAQCTIENAPFDSLIPSLQIGKYDAIIASLAITPQRLKVVDFSNVYQKDTAAVVAKKSVHLSLDLSSLKGKTIGVQGDTSFYQYLKATYGDAITINTYQSEESAFLDLAVGRVDAVMGDAPLIAIWLQQDNHAKEYVYVGKPIDDPKYFGVGDGIAVKKGNVALLQQLNSALAAIKENGQYQKIEQKWFGSL